MDIIESACTPWTASPVSSRFFAPLREALEGCEHRRRCSELCDEDWLLTGIHRVLSDCRSGRAFLQVFGLQAPNLCPGHSAFFEALKSCRRLALCAELNTNLCNLAKSRLPDPLAAFGPLEDFELLAGDGHFHEHAVHDQAIDGTKYATGHFYLLNLRTQLLSHLCVGDQIDRKKEHDMRALKRQDIQSLRHGAGKGRKVLYIWDRAGIDFRFWYELKNRGIYFLSREKENMALEIVGLRAYEATDPINADILSDQIVGSSCGTTVRRVTFFDVLGGKTYSFITNEMTIPPGLLAQLYRMRWEIEKRFDELKNKFGQTKAWASSPNAKTMQAQFICLARNLVHLFEHTLLREEGLPNRAEDHRRDKRMSVANTKAQKAGHILPKAYQALHRATQCSVKLVRWLLHHLFSSTSWLAACKALVTLYASL